jgi:hypothetical protein
MSMKTKGCGGKLADEAGMLIAVDSRRAPAERGNWKPVMMSAFALQKLDAFLVSWA